MSARPRVTGGVAALLLGALWLLPAPGRAEQLDSHAHAASSTNPTAPPITPVTFRDHVIQVKGRPRIVLLGMQAFPREAWAAVERHTTAELRAAGLDVIHAPSVAGDLRTRLAELGAQAAHHRAIGAVRVVRQAGRPVVQVWIYDAITKKMLLRDARASGALPGLDLAKQVVELLNASLIEIKMRRRRPIEKVPKAVVQLVERRLQAPPKARGPLSFAMAPGLSVAPDPARLSPALLLGAGVDLGRWLSLQLQGRLPLMPARLSSPAGEADLATFAAHGLLGLEPWRRSTWSPSLAVGLGVHIVRATGGPEDLVDWTVAPQIISRVALAWRLAPAIQLEAGLALGVLIAEPFVVFASNTRLGLGRLVIEPTIGVRWTL